MKPRPYRAAALVIALLCASPVGAVNVIPNPSFELMNSCPTSFSQLSAASSWDAPTDGTSDYLHTCVTGYPPFPVPQVPLNPLGYQTPRTGNGYGGFIVRNSTNTSYREYLQTPLNAPLVNGQTYNVSFYVNLSDSSYLSTDRIGAYFSVGPVGPTGNDLPLPYTPQIESPATTFLTDTVDWMLISGSFTASGGETHMIIGNFHDDANTAVQSTGMAWPVSYYHVDDTLVELAPPQLQACCTTDALCQMLLPGECLAAGWLPAGPGTSCDPSPCGPTSTPPASWGRVKSTYR